MKDIQLKDIQSNMTDFFFMKSNIHIEKRINMDFANIILVNYDILCII